VAIQLTHQHHNLLSRHLPSPMSTFSPPKVSLDANSNAGIRTLPDLVDFNGKHNPQHTFCIQATRDQRFVSVSYRQLQHAIARCQARLKREDSGLHTPTTDADGHVTKCAPVAILTESHVGLVIYVLACMGMGVPVVLLSARLSSSAVRHLLQETGARLVIVSPTLQALVFEAISPSEGTNGAGENGDGTAAIGVAAEWETLLGEEDAAVHRQSVCVAHATHFASEEDRQVVILHSSGTSGLPKPIPCSHKYFLGYATCHTFASESEAQGLTISTLPLFHVSIQSLQLTMESGTNPSTGLWLRGGLSLVGCRKDCVHPSALNRPQRSISRYTPTTV
jgi:acyl-CoA synthetase (AMP-forming)/AMP-acid ligase II